MSNAILKDFFIPHHGNNYKPHSLHAKRLIGHALGALLIKIVVILAIASMPAQAWLTPDVDYEQGKEIIELTNKERVSLNLQKLVENDKLTQAAILKAEDMLANQYFSHTGPDGSGLKDWLKAVSYNFSLAGENLAMGFSRAEDVMNAWKKSKTHYDNIIDPDFTEIGVGVSSGNYLGEDTTLIAQYFGKQKPEPTAGAGGEVINSASARTADSDDQQSLIDGRESSITVLESPDGNESIVRIVAYLNLSPAKANADINGLIVPLAEDPEEAGRWIGGATVSAAERERYFYPVVMPTVTIYDAAGQVSYADIRIEGVKPSAPSLLSQYFFAKTHQSKYIQPIFLVSSVYFKFLAIFIALALAMNIFIEIKKQHPHVIASALGLLGILVILIVF
jgi:hypothetical protein